MSKPYRIFQFFLFFIVVFNISCKPKTEKGIRETPFKPWAYNQKKVHPIIDSLTIAYMNSRPPRVVADFKNNWTFNYLPNTQEKEELAAVSYNDSKWQAIAIPHTWQTYETTGDVHPFMKNPSERDDPYWWKGWGYYRKHFKINKNLKHKKCFIEFDGVQKYAKIYVNGKYIGDHKGGYNSFSMDITDAIHQNKENVLVVMVNNSRRDKFRIPPMTAGNFNVYGGIYRDVRLVIKNDVYIPYQGNYNHKGGTFVTTPHVNNDSATANMLTYVRNATQKQQKITLRSTILSPKGKKVAKRKSTQILKPNTTFKFDQTAKNIKDPLLWAPDSPVLYKVINKVFVNGKLKDEYQSTLGFRYFHWDYKKNDLYINGKKIRIKGINRHQEYPWLGDAIPGWITKKDMYDIKYGLGFNFMRAAHYPNDPLLYDMADQLGIVMVEEVPNIKSIDFSEKVQKQNVKEMIRRDRNHPSIFFWSMGNETNDAANSKWAVAEDTTRFIHERKSKGYGDFVNHDDTNLDMEQLLRVTIRGWFTKADAPKNINVRPKNGQVASSEYWQHQMAMKKGGSVRGGLNQNMVGWIYADHGADREYKNSPLLHINAKGWVDSYRIPKYLYYLTRANYVDYPVLFIQPDFWRKKYIGQKKNFFLDSNCDQVKVFINDSLIDTVYPNRSEFNSVVVKDIPVQHGTLKVIGKKGGKIIKRSLKIPGKPVKIVLKSTQDELVANRSGLAAITAYLLDKDGNVVFDAENTLKWKVSGAGKLVGYSIYKSDINKHEAKEGTGYTVAPVSNLVRTTNVPGKIKVTVTSNGLAEGSVELISNAPKKATNGIEQPDLNDQGRTPVKKIQNFTEKRNYKEIISKIRGNKHFEKGADQDYQIPLNKFIQNNNKKVNDYPKAYTLFLNQLEANLRTMKGTLIADDFNFLAGQFNDFAMLSRAIKSINLHVKYAQLLEQFYAEQMLEKNRQLDIQNEINMLRKIPSDHLPLYIYKPNKKNKAGKIEDNYVKKSYKVWTNDAVSAIKTAFPSYQDLDEQEKERVYAYIAKITPYVHYDSKHKKFKFEKEKILIIPSPDVQLFLKNLEIKKNTN